MTAPHTGTLELLFARAAQGRTFLLMAAGGAALGVVLQAANWLNLRNRAAGIAADVLLALLASALLLLSVGAGGGLRGYALLGVLLGLMLYRAGVAPLAAGAFRVIKKLFAHRQESRQQMQNLL